MRKKIKLAIVAQPEYFGFIYGNDLDEYYDVLYLPMRFEVGADYFQPLIDFNADINFFFRGEFVPEGVLEKLKGLRVAWSSEPFPRYINRQLNCTTDSIGRMALFLTIKDKPFDYIFHYDESSSALLEKLGVFLSDYQYFSVATESYYPMPTDYAWDVFFIGRTTNHRQAFFNKIKSKYRFLNIVHGVTDPKKLTQFICASRVSLNLHAENEISFGSRLQLLMSCGAVAISEPLPENKLIAAGKHYLEVKNNEAFETTLCDVLENYDQYKHIGENARNNMLEKCAAKKIFPEIISKLLEGRYAKPIFQKKKIDLDSLYAWAKYRNNKMLSVSLGGLENE